eukprot:CAMPEP_0180571370 /NCGR_PEP_ID=MMETSP1037_2-20121125/8684_1 /TAXON_ID=632150 /ORGANISM="Azadinium spinosum, Strain 3D9" /LENGTH=196 /DNA_ID=CAMNT_0022588685 /DNA_START=108 /DNA_END=696 /DNA_ORIENTATION=+
MTLREKLEEIGISVWSPIYDVSHFRWNPFNIQDIMPWKWFDLKDHPRLGIRGLRTRGISRPEPSRFVVGPGPGGGVWGCRGGDREAAGCPCRPAPDDQCAALAELGARPGVIGEDPLFNGRMGAGVVRGAQSKGTMACAKHFLSNNIENTRWFVSAEYDDKALHEVYLKAWAVIVAESAPEWVMTSYNRVQGNWSN